MQETDNFTLQAVEQQMKLAAIWQIRGKLSQAIASCERAIQLQPDYMPAYLVLIDLLVQIGQSQQAVETYHRVIKIEAEKAWMRLFADCNLERENFAEQEALIKQAIWHYQDRIRRRSEAEEPLHILLYTNCPGTYGAEQVSHALMLRLAQLGYRVTCVQGKADHHLIHAREASGIRHIWLEGDAYRFVYTVSNASEAAEIFFSVLPDLIIFADGNPMDDLAAIHLAIRLEIPYIRIIHCVIPRWSKEFASYLCLLPDTYRSAKAIISVSQANLKLMREKFELPEQVGQIIYNGRAGEYFTNARPQVRGRLRQALAIPQDAIVIFTAARMYTAKGYQHQVNAIRQLRHLPIWPKLYFVWAGSGNLEDKLKADIEQLGVSQQVKFLGERVDIPDLLDAADLFLLPSHFEGMPLAIMEAMAKGLPVMATAISGIPEEVGETVQLLPDPNIDAQATVKAIVDTIQTWAIDAELRQTVGNLCQQRAMMLFREERMLDKYVTLIQQVLHSYR